MELKDIYFRFSSPREQQKELLLDTVNAMQEGKHLVAHAPTGLGKTDSTLSAAITVALKENKTVFFLTPKISQHEIAVQVVRDIAKKYKLNLKAVDLVGRRYACTDPILGRSDFDGFYEICARKRRNEECVYYRNARGYEKKEREIAKLHLDRMMKKYETVWSHHEVKEYCENERPMCAYEALIEIAKNSDVIIADYFHLFNPSIQEVILPKLKVKLEDSIIVVDEAHNLGDRIRNLLSSTVSSFSLRRGEEELKKLNRMDLAEKLHELEKIIKGIARHSLKDKGEEALISKESLMKPLDSLVPEIEEFVEELRANATDYMEATSKTKSSLLPIANFLEKWPQELEAHIRMIKMNRGGNYAVSLKALDPSIVSRKIFSKAHSAVLMSGTLLPTKMYADLLGLEEERTLLKEYSSPFPKENRMNLIVPTSTTKYTERKTEEFKKIAEETARIVNSVPGNSAVFFPSFKLLSQIEPYMDGLCRREMLIQKAGMNSNEINNLLTHFRNSGSGFGSVLLAVAQGSLAEGIDLPGNQLLCAVIVGIPLAEMNLEIKCLIDYFEEKFHRGWHYAYIYPAVNKAIQAGGRVIRDEGDEGIVVFLDKRYIWKNYSNCFPKDFSKIITSEPEKYVKLFWEKKD
ncbi:MAG: ATP-dependent DNA helicase [archaeon]